MQNNCSYRFVLLPETIGSISYLSKYKKVLKKNVICGYNLTAWVIRKLCAYRERKKYFSGSCNRSIFKRF